MMSPDQPTAARDIAAYERAYGESPFEATQARYRKRMLLELLARERPRRVLEVGCGLDTLANHWREAERFVIVEPGGQFAEQARRDTAGRGDVVVIESPLEDAAPSLGQDFDLILLSGLLHEVADCGRLMASARGLCGPRTLVHANVPNARSFHRLLAVEMGLIAEAGQTSEMQKTLQQPRIFDLESLTALAEGHGFSVADRGSYFVKPFTHAQMLRLQNEGFLTETMLEGLWGIARQLPDVGSEIFVNMRAAP